MMFMPELNHISCLTYHTAGFTAITSAFPKHLQHIMYIIFFKFKTSMLVSRNQLWEGLQWPTNFDRHLQEWTLNPFLSLLVQTDVISHTLSIFVWTVFPVIQLVPPQLQKTLSLWTCFFFLNLLRITAKLSTTILSKLMSRSTANKTGCGKTMTAVECVWPITCTKSCRL